MKPIGTGHTRRKGDRGYILAMSLVIMMFGAIVVSSMLTYITAATRMRNITGGEFNAYYAADAGIQAAIGRLLDPYSMDSGNPLPETGSDIPYYTISGPLSADPGQSCGLFAPSAGLSSTIDEYEPRMTVKWLEVQMFVPLEPGYLNATSYVKYEIVANACDAQGASQCKIDAVVLQTPYPSMAGPHRVMFVSWQPD